jgi:molybdate transport system regulatory protein
MKSKNSTALQLRCRILWKREIAFGPGKAELLELVAKTGSIGQAARRMKMSYMRAWSLIQTMNACFKAPVVEAARGGHQRGGAALTEIGRQVLKLYRRMEAKSSKAAQSDCRKIQKLLR